jgi:hypothetical protein
MDNRRIEIRKQQTSNNNPTIYCCIVHYCEAH